MTIPTLRSGTLRASLDPISGAAITSITDSHHEFLAPKFAAPGSLSFDVAGWQTMFPNAGAACHYLESAHPAHGEAFHGSWGFVRLNRGSAAVRFASTVLPLSIDREVAVDDVLREVTVRDSIRNHADHTVLFQYGHHVVFSADEDSVIRAPSAKMGHCVSGDFSGDLGKGISVTSILDAGPEGLAVLSVPGSVWLESPYDDRCVRLQWSTDLMPTLWVWASRLGGRNGRWSYAVGLEPVSSRGFGGLADAVRTGEAASVGPYSQRTSNVAVRLGSLTRNISPPA